MTCRHAKGDPACSSTVGGYAHREAERYREEAHRKEVAEAEERARKATAEQYARTPDSEKYEVVQAERVDAHLVLKVLYPNCAKCAYEGHKVMVFLNVTEADVLRWRKIDPHFRDPKAARAPREAPSPAARFPASPDGWCDALTYARGKDRAASPEKSEAGR